MALLDELTTGPLAAEIAPLITSGNDGAILAVLQRKDIPALGSVPCSTFARWCVAHGQRGKLEDAASDPTDATRDIALSLKDLLLRDKPLDFSDPGIVALAQAWKTAGKMTQSDYDSLATLALVNVSRADQLAYPVSIELIAHALRG